MVRPIQSILDRTVRSMLFCKWRCGRGQFWSRWRRCICNGEAGNGRSERPGRTHHSHRAGNGWRRRCGATPPPSWRIANSRRGRNQAPRQRRRRRPATEKPAAPPADAAGIRRAEIRQAQIRHDGRRRIAGARGRRLWRLLHAGRPLLRLDRRRLCPRQQHHAGRAGGGPCRRDPARRQFDRSHRRRRSSSIDDGDYQIAVDAARTKIATQQATIDRIGRQVTALESAVEQAKAQLVSAEAA